MDGEAATAEVVEQPLGSGIETPGYEEPVEHEDVSEQPITDERESEAESREPGEFGEISDREVVDALKELKRLDPKYARVVERMRKDNFEVAQYRSAFPSARAAAQAAAEFKTVGGTEGLAEYREKDQWIKWVDEAAERGDGSIIDDWAQSFPEGFREVAPYAVQKYAQLDPQGFAQAITPHFSGFLDRAHLSDRLSEAFDAIEAGNGRGAQSLLRNIYAWVAAQRQYAVERGDQNANPAEEKLTQRENAVRQQEDLAFRKEIGRETYRYQQDSVSRALAPYLRGAKISEQARARLISAIDADINQNLERNEGFQRQMKAFLAKRDSQGTIDYLKAQLDMVIPSISRRLWQDLYGPAPKAAKAAPFAGANGDRRGITASAGPIRLNRKPELAEIQKDRDYMAAYIAGQAIMAKGPYKGKLVRWK